MCFYQAANLAAAAPVQSVAARRMISDRTVQILVRLPDIVQNVLFGKLDHINAVRISIRLLW
jgi:hypothetical protein